MKLLCHYIIPLVLLSAFSKVGSAQGYVDTSTTRISLAYVEHVSSKAAKVEQKLYGKSEKALRKFLKQQDRLKRKLSKIDSLAASNTFAIAGQRVSEFQLKLEQPQKFTGYVPLLDTIKTSLKFLNLNKELVSNTKESAKKLTKSIAQFDKLEQQLQKADEIKEFMKRQRGFLKEELQKFGFGKQLKKLNKEAYYYSEQVKEYKRLVQDKSKRERKAIELLSKTRMFQDFMKKHSMLASLFRLPVDDPNDPTYLQSLAGLQTRVQVNQLVQQQISAAGPGALQQVRSNLQEAQTQLQALKDKLTQAVGRHSSDDELPDFRPNGQRVKSFFNRIEVGTNMQSQKSDVFFPVTSDIGLSLGYKLHDKSVIGIGASYKIGWGTGFRHIAITSQGVGVRSFLDYQLKKTFWLSGGYEMNYRSAFNHVDQLKDLNGWQRSGLVGISKKLAMSTRFFQSTKVQLLWDFLSYQQIPRTQPFVFRIGYNLK
jgi:hypothetical protein